MRFTRARDLVVIALVAAVVVHLVIRSAYTVLPTLPRLAGITLLVVAAVDVVLGFSVRARVQHKAGAKPVAPLAAARAVALAKASSLVGAIMLGTWVGFVGYVLPRRGELVAAASDTISALIGVVCAAALIGAGLWLEYCCKTPDRPDDDAGNDRSAR
ncbi:DUF3180 domain-containing protein [Goodfellowiella coeruleoviolacea]|uniref:DUF3180 domain-containing protein n=1 Tax=Goodfellowiella coeruleoviolacea TaxID=334858 RepID=A0AAE3KDY6_9PSEU|nr:DUF3180 domain-containing protein [Goodfellowiella coeruleoviolacea]MCP2164676.1 Protein of unknown function (DUF3180) [Goodfellowiella coeruleoviolacea]